MSRVILIPEPNLGCNYVKTTSRAEKFLASAVNLVNEEVVLKSIKVDLTKLFITF